MVLKTRVMAACYQDSVVLMRISAQVRERASVREVALFMGTPANHALLAQAGLATDAGSRAGPNDLVATVSADDDAAASAAIAAVEALLAESTRSREASSEYRPRSLESALRALPDANLVSISVPGAYARSEAMSALRRNRHVFVFSDNVPVEDEIALKEEAMRRRLLCMGPDQGTAYLGGVGLGFANRVRRGRVGLVAASGTGLQAVACRLDGAGEGVSHAIGVGGRDLSEAVGGRMTLFALEILAGDPATEAIVLISKPPHRSVLERLEASLEATGKPTVACCIGAEPRRGGRTTWVATLDRAADASLAVLAGSRWEPTVFSDVAAVRRSLAALDRQGGCEGRRIVGLYTGGTLAYETAHVLATSLGSDHPHRILDLGDDAYTVGRPHPMIDPRPRSERIVEAASDASVGVLLLDVVLGAGSHPNPAQPLAEAVSEARRTAAGSGRQLGFLASIVGTSADPQGFAEQSRLLGEAGVELLPANGDAARVAAMAVSPELRAHWLQKAA